MALRNKLQIGTGALIALLAVTHAIAIGLPDRRHVLVVGSSTAYPIIAAAAE